MLPLPALRLLLVRPLPVRPLWVRPLVVLPSTGTTYTPSSGSNSSQCESGKGTSVHVRQQLACVFGTGGFRFELSHWLSSPSLIPSSLPHCTPSTLTLLLLRISAMRPLAVRMISMTLPLAVRTVSVGRPLGVRPLVCNSRQQGCNRRRKQASLKLWLFSPSPRRLLLPSAPLPAPPRTRSP